MKRIVSIMLLLLPLLLFAGRKKLSGYPLAQNGRAMVSVFSPKASATQQFAASELTRYLKKISGADFKILTQKPAGSVSAIVLEINRNIPLEDYSISYRDRQLVLAAGSDRAALYVVYDFLQRLGCVWLAPQFSFYKGRAEQIPNKPVLDYDGSKPVYEHPRFAYRKIDIEEGLSHTPENLQQLIEWMPKVRLNVFMVPLNYQGSGRVKWENWRQALTPELKKRGILIEVGGHGYQNFLNARMENGTLFTKHPDWFGKNRNCEPDSVKTLVFNTSNPQAVNYFLSNIVQYLREHPEIDIFDCWPPDVAKWAECPALAALGTAEDRQAVLMNQVDSAIRKNRPGLQVEVIAYGQVLNPPQHISLNKNILVDICPINQRFEKQINNTVNSEYLNAINAWRKKFDGNIGLYSYYRKYAWKSLPAVLPHYIQQDLQWFASLPLQGISTYAEPGDWYTYELNHYVLAALAWNPEVSVDAMLRQYARIRYGAALELAVKACNDLEELVRQFCSLPYTTIKTPEELRMAALRLLSSKEPLVKLLGTVQDKYIEGNVRRLCLMLQYAIADLEIQQLRAANKSGPAIEEKVSQLVSFLEQHADEGVFVLRAGDNLPSFLNRYRSSR
jgi:hypothetical protein